MDKQVLRIFVYDELMYGLGAHKVFCVSDELRGDLVSVEPASIPVGKRTRRNTPYGNVEYVEIDKKTIERNTLIGDICTDFLVDLKCAKFINRPSGEAATTTPQVYGEILTFTGTKEQLQTRLCYLDAFKGFRTETDTLGASHYWRVLVNATSETGTYPVWVWVKNPLKKDQK